ncbi:MAG TPA: ABC transporter permease [Bryobacteraceae bacterium]|nr:ABC transporter permease [Bryobacteraceae bacterium]
MNNLRYSIRLLLKSPGFSLVAILTLALGIGVNSAIFSIVDAVMLRPLPYPHPDRLVSIWEEKIGDGPNSANTSGQSLGKIGWPARWTVSPANLTDYRTQKNSFVSLAGFAVTGMNLTESGPPERLFGEQVTANYFSTLGVSPAHGRAFLPEEDHPGANKVVIVSDELWHSRFGGDPHLLESSITLDHEKYTVVGIMPAGFKSPSQFNMTIPLLYYIPAAYPAVLLANHGNHTVNVLGRLKPGGSLSAARAELDGISQSLAQRYPNACKNLKAGADLLSSDISGGVRTSLFVLLGAVGLILLIACANLANLLLVRAIGRQKEIAIRFALGASRGRVIGELLAQSAILAALGCGAGLAFGSWTEQLLIGLAPHLPRLEEESMNGQVLFFAMALSAAAGLVCGILPAWQASKSRPVEAMRASGRQSAGNPVLRWRSAFMVAELAVSMVLLVGAGLLLKSFVTLNHVELGIATERVLDVRISLPDLGYGTPQRREAFFEDLAGRVGALPGVQAVAFANNFPLRGGWSSDYRAEEHPESGPEADYQAVSPGYFATLGITLERGRLLTAADRNGSLPVAVINEELARRLYPNQDPVGKRFRLRDDDQPWIAIAGVVSDVRRDGKAGKMNPEVYLPAAQTSLYPVRLSELCFRSASDPKALIGAVQRQVWAIDKDIPITNVRTYDEIVSQSVSEKRFQTLLLGLFAALALILAVVGIYGVISYSVSQRIPEIGVRMALGASRGQILAMVLGRAMFLTAAGIAAGVLGALALSRYLKTLLFQVAPGDPWTYASIAAILAAVACVASLIPARRATRVDPLVALRYE